jgi:hypothetical protein
MNTIAVAALLCGFAAAQNNKGCDRACLEGFVDKYFDALAAHDPHQLPLARNVKFTENGQRLELPDALWNSFVSKGTYRLFVTDTSSGEVAFIGTIREEAQPPRGRGGPATAATPGPPRQGPPPTPGGGILALRLKVDKGQISEIETLVVRNEGAAQNLENLGKSNPLFLETIPLAERMSREDLIKTANMYFSGMEKNDGKMAYPFTDDCDRLENGARTTNAPVPPGQTKPDPATSTNYSAQWSCKEQFESGLLHFVWRIRDRRFVAVDPERGLVYAFGFFDHALGKHRTFQTPTGRTVTGGPTQPWTWELAELFRIEKGKIRRIEAILDRAPFGMNSGWSNWEDGMSSRARDIH